MHFQTSRDLSSSLELCIPQQAPLLRCFSCRYLLLEDADTGDMLMPLIYMKPVFETNYSRKLSSLKHRLVTIPADVQLPDGRANAYLYWRWAFEAPPHVKLLVRQELGDNNTPQVSLCGPCTLDHSQGAARAIAVKEASKRAPVLCLLRRRCPCCQSGRRARLHAEVLRNFCACRGICGWCCCQLCTMLWR